MEDSMTRMFKTVAVAAFLVSVMGCNKYMIKTGAGGDTGSAPKKSEWQMHFVDGLIGEGNFDVQQICGGPDATIKIERSILDGIISSCTGLLVMPSHVDVYCGAGATAPTAQLPLTQHNAEVIAKSDEFRAATVAIAPDRVAEVDAIRAR
jgi:hypothetical protein